jgi:glycosyltransferase involved in cell wall biosynthesis
VHAHHTLGLSIDLLDAARRAGAKVITTIHDFWYLCPRGQRFTPWGENCAEIDFARCSRCIAKKRVRWGLLHLRAGLRRPLRTLAGLPGYVRENLHTRALRHRTAEIVAELNACDRVLAGSQFVLDEHVRHGLLPARARRFENGIDAAWTAQLPARDAPNRPLRFGYVGSFLSSKGVDLLVTAFQSMPREGATLDLHGTSPWDGGVFARKVEAGNRHPLVRFHGAFGRERLAGILATIDVLVVPSRWFENVPVTMDEAALARIPVVVAGHGGMAESSSAGATARVPDRRRRRPARAAAALRGRAGALVEAARLRPAREEHGGVGAGVRIALPRAAGGAPIGLTGAPARFSSPPVLLARLAGLVALVAVAVHVEQPVALDDVEPLLRRLRRLGAANFDVTAL